MKLSLFTAAVLGALGITLGACGSSSSSSDNGFPQPPTTVALNFTVDDSAYPTYTDGQLQWKGAFIYDATTRMIVFDNSWTGPYIPLYDDGPWDKGGHEPKGATKGDHKFGATAFLTVPTTALTIEYGLIDEKGGWIWVNPSGQGGNGKLVVPANSTTEQTAVGMAIPAAGTTDFRLTLDDTALFSGFTFTAGDTVTVKGGMSAWAEMATTLTGHNHVFTLSDHVGPGKDLPHAGLLKSGAIVPWTFVVHSVEYKDSGNASHAGVTAEYKPAGGAWTAGTIIDVDNGFGALNTAITIP